jgi:hypothetical protein
VARLSFVYLGRSARRGGGQHMVRFENEIPVWKETSCRLIE